MLRVAPLHRFWSVPLSLSATCRPAHVVVVVLPAMSAGALAPLNVGVPVTLNQAALQPVAGDVTLTTPVSPETRTVAELLLAIVPDSATGTPGITPLAVAWLTCSAV